MLVIREGSRAVCLSWNLGFPGPHRETLGELDLSGFRLLVCRMSSVLRAPTPTRGYQG